MDVQVPAQLSKQNLKPQPHFHFLIAGVMVSGAAPGSRKKSFICVMSFVPPSKRTQVVNKH